MMTFADGSGISWTICKQPAPRSRQITTSTPHQSISTGWMLLLMPNQQCQSTEGMLFCKQNTGINGTGFLWVECSSWHPSKKVSNKCIAVRKVATLLWELTCHMGSHSVTCHPTEVTFPPLPQPKLVLD